ncbi:MAG TPA: hypothetical protein PLU22_21780 [Polyangiaceae bacterium]|nr:hypothetical protein [Polyangiaceae bacterium]
MPALVLPLLAFTIGIGLAWAAAGEIERLGGTALGSRSLLLAAAFGTLVTAPIAAYLVAFYPDWAYAFAVDSARLPSVVPSALTLASAAAPPLGFTVAARFAGERRLGRLLELAAGGAAAALITLLPGAPRLGVQATYAQYHGDFGVVPIVGSRLGLALLWMLAVLVGAVVWTATSMRKLARAEPRR